MVVSNLIPTSLDMITLFDFDGNFLCSIDELQDTTLSNGEEVVDITGKGGRKLASLKRNKTLEVSGTNGVVSLGLMELQTGSSFEDTDEALVKYSEVVKVTAEHKANITYAAEGTAGTEIKAVYVIDKDGSQVKKLEQMTGTATAGKFTYTNKVITLHADDVTADDEIRVFYTRKVSGSVLKNISDKYSQKCVAYIDGQAEDTCGNIYHMQYCIPKADFSGEFETALGGDQTTQAFKISGLAGACATAGEFWSYTVFGADED